MSGSCIAVRDDGAYDGATAAELENGGLFARPHPELDGWLLIEEEGLHGSDPEDVDFEIALYGFTCRIQEHRHAFLPVDGHPEDDECTHRDDGTDETYCGLAERDHITASSRVGGDS